MPVEFWRQAFLRLNIKKNPPSPPGEKQLEKAITRTGRGFFREMRDKFASNQVKTLC